MQSTARVVVVGGGCVGVGVLYGLAKRGWSDCVLLERRTLGSASTRLAGGFIPTYVRHNALSRLINKTIEIYAGLEAETGLSVGMHRNGQMRIARSADRLDEYLSYMNTAEANGANAALLSPSETRDLWPLMRDSNGVFGALYHPDDAYVGPTDVTMAMAKGARDRGARIEQDTQVLGFAQRPGGDWTVMTTAGEIVCEHVVLATGNYARQTGAMLGLDVPAIPLVVQYWLTEAIPEIVERKRQGLPEMPIVRDEAYLGYTREEGDGLMFGSYERPEHLKLFGVDGVPETYDGEMLPADLDAHAWAFEVACDLVPPLARAGIRANIRGPMQMTADGLPLVGPAAGLRNIWLAEGVPGGILWGGTIGHSLSEWIIEGGTSTDLTALDPRRFGDYATKDWTRRKVIETWGSHSDCHIPGEEMPAGRPAKTAPSYDRLDALGAMWGVRHGWETPNWYAPVGTPRHDAMTYRDSHSGPHVADEVRAVRTGVGLIEMTALAKFEVTGPGALAFLDGLLANRLPPVGKIATVHHLHDNGGVRSQYTVAHLAEDVFLLISAPQAETLNFDTLRRCLHPDGGVILRNVTMERGAFILSGPKARDVVGAIADIDVSDGVLPFHGVATASLGLVPDVRILRVATTGEVTYELHHPIAYQRHLLDALLAAGASHDLKLVGTRALASLRLDKSTREWPTELAPDISALEAGLDAFLGFDKPDFPGRDALLAQRSRGLDRRIATLLVDSSGLSPMGDEGVYTDGRLIGRITSAGWSHHLGRPVALALMPVALAQPGTPVMVPVLETWCEARVVEHSPYDSADERCR